MEFTNPNGSKVVFNLNDVRSCVAEGTGSFLFTRTGSGKTQVQESPATIATNSCGNIVLFTVYSPANQFNDTKQMGVNPNYVVGVVSNTSGNGVLKMITPTENFTTTSTYNAAVALLSICVSGGGGGGSLTNTYVGFGDGLNQLDGEAGFTYDAESNRLAVDTVKTKRISSKSGPLEILNDTKYNAYPNTRDDSGAPVNILNTDASGILRSDPVSSIFTSLSARNGITNNSGNVELGQAVGAVGDPAALTSHREIPTAGFDIRMMGAGKFSVGGYNSFSVAPITSIANGGDLLQLVGDNSNGIIRIGTSDGTTRGLIGYSMPNQIFSNSLPNALKMRSENAIELGVGSSKAITIREYGYANGTGYVSIGGIDTATSVLTIAGEESPTIDFITDSGAGMTGNSEIYRIGGYYPAKYFQIFNITENKTLFTSDGDTAQINGVITGKNPSGGVIQYMKPSNFGYSVSYKAPVFGIAGQPIGIGDDPSLVTDGIFTGNEILLAKTAYIINDIAQNKYRGAFKIDTTSIKFLSADPFFANPVLTLDRVSNTAKFTSLSGTGRRFVDADASGVLGISPTQPIAALAPVGSTPNANAATLSGSTLNLEPANASFPGVVTTSAQTFSGQKTINMASSGAVTQNLVLDNTATAAVNSAASMAQSVAGVQRGEFRTTLTEIVGGGADYAKTEIKAQDGGALEVGVLVDMKNAGVDNVAILPSKDGSFTAARRIVTPYSNVALTGDATLTAGYSTYVLTGTQILTDVWTITMPTSASMLDGEIITITNSVPGVTGATLQLTANSGQTLFGFTGTISFANPNGFSERKAIQLMFKTGGTWITLAHY